MLLSRTITIPLSEFIERGQYHAPANTPITPLFDMNNLSSLLPVEELQGINENLKSIGKVCHYLLNPKQLLLALWSCVVEYSYVICLLICIIGAFIYISGHKKSAKLISGSILGYTFIQILNLVIK